MSKRPQVLRRKALHDEAPIGNEHGQLDQSERDIIATDKLLELLQFHHPERS